MNILLVGFVLITQAASRQKSPNPDLPFRLRESSTTRLSVGRVSQGRPTTNTRGSVESFANTNHRRYSNTNPVQTKPTRAKGPEALSKLTGLEIDDIQKCFMFPGAFRRMRSWAGSKLPPATLRQIAATMSQRPTARRPFQLLKTSPVSKPWNTS